jgi:DNA methylase
VSDRNARRERLYRERLDTERRAHEAIEALGEGAYDVVLASVTDWRPEGVSAIICDPPYLPRESVPANYRALAEMATDVLPEGGHLVAMTDVASLAVVLGALDVPGMNYRGCISWDLDKRSASQYWPRRAFQRWKPVVVMTKGSWKHSPWFSERHLSEGTDKELHNWQQSLDGFVKLARWFALPGETVATPFCGSGTAGVASLAAARRWVGCDTDPEAVKMSRARIGGHDYVAPRIIR